MTVMWTGMPREWPLQESGAACIVKHMVTWLQTPEAMAEQQETKGPDTDKEPAHTGW